MEILHHCAWLQDPPWVGVGTGNEGGRERSRGEFWKWGENREDRSVEGCAGFRHTWTGGYAFPIWGGASWWSWVSRFPDARLSASGLGSLDAFDSSGVAVTLVVCLSLTL